MVKFDRLGEVTSTQQSITFTGNNDKAMLFSEQYKGKGWDTVIILHKYSTPN